MVLVFRPLNYPPDSYGNLLEDAPATQTLVVRGLQRARKSGRLGIDITM